MTILVCGEVRYFSLESEFDMPVKALSNGNARWAMFVFVLLTALVGIVMYVADVRADVNQNTATIIRVEKDFKSMYQIILRIERRQLFMLQFVGIKSSNIPGLENDYPPDLD